MSVTVECDSYIDFKIRGKHLTDDQIENPLVFIIVFLLELIAFMANLIDNCSVYNTFNSLFLLSIG